MNRSKRNFIRAFGSFSDLFSIKFLSAITRQKLILPVYHLVADHAPPHIRHLYRIRSRDTFKQDLDELLKYYTPIDLVDLKNTITERRPLKNKFFLSFDDGLREIYHIVAPILKEKGIPATFFLNSAFIDNKELFYRYKASLIIEEIKKNKLEDKINHFSKSELKIDLSKFSNNYLGFLLSVNYIQQASLDKLASFFNLNFDEYLKENQPYLNSTQIQELIKDGFTIGAHSVDHPDYRLISLEEQIRQTKESVKFIVNKFPLDYKAFAFPFTDQGITRKYFETIFSSENNIDLSFGSAGLKGDMFPQHLQRMPIEDTGLPMKKILATEYLYYLAKAPLLKNRITRK